MTKLHVEALRAALRAQPGARTADLCARLGGIDKSTLTRGLKVLGDEAVSRGGSRRTAYALRRAIRGNAASVPLYRIDEAGRGHQIGLLDSVYPAGTALSFQEPFPWPLTDEMRDGWFDGLPYPLADMRPQGFLGRNFARHHALSFDVAENPEDWYDDDISHILAILGSDMPGNLILGDTAFQRYLDFTRTGQERFLADDQIETAYPRFAAAAMAQGVPDSSAGGEFPKFTASRLMHGQPVDVIVKFSGADNSPAVQRWADLLVCEHIALTRVQNMLTVPAATSWIYRFAGRTFLEVVRFDRHGMFGRSGMCTLHSVNAALLGMAAAPWLRVAGQMLKQKLIDESAAHAIELVWWFGRLIGNTDMHDGNLAFRPAHPGLALAPIYDMLPMLYAPARGGEVASPAFVPALPLPSERPGWLRAAVAGVAYWQQCAEDSRISQDFRRICAGNAAILDDALKTQG